jgi:hypothetical protein
VENRTRIELPAGVQRPFEVFVNGVAQSEGTDFEVIGSSLLFDRAFVRERKLPLWRWALLFLGFWSSYRHHDTIDLVYTLNGRRAVANLTPAATADAA